MLNVLDGGCLVSLRLGSSRSSSSIASSEDERSTVSAQFVTDGREDDMEGS